MKKFKNFLSKKFKAFKQAWLEAMYIQGQNLMMTSGAYKGKPTWSLG